MAIFSSEKNEQKLVRTKMSTTKGRSHKGTFNYDVKPTKKPISNTYHMKPDVTGGHIPTFLKNWYHQ